MGFGGAHIRGVFALVAFLRGEGGGRARLFLAQLAPKDDQLSDDLKPFWKELGMARRRTFSGAPYSR